MGRSETGKLYLIVYADPGQPEAYSKAKQRLKDLRMMLRRSVDAPVTSASVRTEAVRDFSKEDYLKAVAVAKRHKGARVTAIDISPEALAVAARNASKRSRSGNRSDASLMPSPLRERRPTEASVPS